ncbi:MAG: hypothetical protein D6705_13170 [Deltaproteobacteria bacterium]|nr:MAG: hypothetical protein D6705_13170 [Deltaproteobacteria bacterium]
MVPASVKRRLVAFVASLFLHLSILGVGWISMAASLEMPDIEIEFTEVTLLDPDAVQGEQPEPEPEPQKVAPPAPPKPEPPDDGTEAEAEPEPEKKDPRKEIGRRPSRVDRLGPTNATFYAFLVNRRIRRLPFAEKGIEVMAPLPDFQFLVQGGGFHPLRDFDYMVIASPDVRDVTQTFLAVQYNLPREEVVQAVERAAERAGETITWEERGGYTMGNPRPADPNRPDVDPRWIVFLDDRVAVYVREEFLPHILTEPSNDAKTSGNFVANLTRMRRFAAREPRAGMQIVLKDIHAALRRVRGLPFPMPDHVQVTVEAAKSPTLVVDATFLSSEDARAFARWYQRDLAAILDDNWTVKAMAGWIYRLLEIEHEGRKVRIAGTFSTKQATSVLDLLASLSRKMLHKTPEEAERDRKAREEMWRRRQGGKLPPSAAFGEDDARSATTGDGDAGNGDEAARAKRSDDGTAAGGRGAEDAPDAAGERSERPPPPPADEAPPN